MSTPLGRLTATQERGIEQRAIGDVMATWRAVTCPWRPLTELVRLSHLWYMHVTLELYGAISGSRATMLMFV